MGEDPSTISPNELIARIGTRDCPPIFDVRRAEKWAEAPDLIPAARWRDHTAAATWGLDLPRDREVVVYCVHGHNVSQLAAALLRSVGVRARVLDTGVEGYRAAGGLMLRKDAVPTRDESVPSHWVTRERPKIDRIACPWFIRRFMDRDARIHYVASDWVGDVAEEMGAIPFDIPDVAFSHVGELCSFDAFLEKSGIADPALGHLARLIRAADTGHADREPQAAGLLAASLGLSAMEPDDLAMMEQGFLIYDALYTWCRHAAAETHGWPPAPAKSAV
jgi:rhodanese-related sulfurtransferase